MMSFIIGCVALRSFDTLYVSNLFTVGRLGDAFEQ